uniref:GT23 domain-containing protein n=1 Tax=Ciona savignyi TaxID=51511 RepID=H2YUS0_CIOSA
MKHVEEWYDRYELKQELEGNSDKVERRVYLATDDPTTWNETLQFSQYTFVGNIEFTKRASKFETRDTGTGLEDIIIDITLLSKCHFLVCTLSSEIGRVAMELKQSRHDSDVFYDVRSLEYDYGLTDGPNKIQLVQYASGEKATSGEIQIQPGDMIIMTRNYWNGFYYGTNVRSGKKGLYPTHKVINLPALIELPNAAVLNTLKAVYENYLPWLFNQMISFE